MLLVFFVAALVAYVIVRGCELRRQADGDGHVSPCNPGDRRPRCSHPGRSLGDRETSGNGVAMLNRGVVIVRPKQPYLDWAAGLDDSGLVPDPNDEQTVYLIPSYGDDEEAWEILERVHPAIFENELYGWHTDEAAWPQGRDLAMFKAWFEIELHSVVEDLCDYEIVDEDDEA
jgi:hypothetical protein